MTGLDRRVEHLAHTTPEMAPEPDEAPAGAKGIWREPDQRDFATADADYDAWRDHDDVRSHDAYSGRDDHRARDIRPRTRDRAMRLAWRRVSA